MATGVGCRREAEYLHRDEGGLLAAALELRGDAPVRRGALEAHGTSTTAVCCRSVPADTLIMVGSEIK